MPPRARQQPKLATSAVLRKLVALGSIPLRQNPLWQDAPAPTFRLLEESHLIAITDARRGDGGNTNESDIGHSLLLNEGTTPPVAVAFAGGLISVPAEAT